MRDPRLPFHTHSVFSHTHTHPLAHTDTHMPSWWNPILSPGPSSLDSVSIQNARLRGRRGGSRETERGMEGAEIRPRGRGLRPHSVSAQQWRGGSGSVIPFLPFLSPCFLSLSSLICSLRRVNYTKQTHVKIRGRTRFQARLVSTSLFSLRTLVSNWTQPRGPN